MKNRMKVSIRSCPMHNPYLVCIKCAAFSSTDKIAGRSAAFVQCAQIAKEAQ